MSENNESLYYSIGQVARHTGLPQSVLRYWESVFPMLRPAKSAGGSRQYSNQDIELILEIKNLLYAQGFTIKGAKSKLRERETQPVVSNLSGSDPAIAETAQSVEVTAELRQSGQSGSEADSVIIQAISDLKKVVQLLQD